MIPSISERALLGKLGKLITSMLPENTPVIRAQVNRVPMPLDDFVLLTPLYRTRLSTNVTTGFDIMFRASITGDILDVTEMGEGGPLVLGQVLFSPEMLEPRTRIIAFGTGEGGVGTYRITPPGQDRAEGTIYAGTWTAMMPTEVVTQLDIFGPAACENAQVISTLMRDEYAASWWDHECPGAVQTLFADDPRQMPFIDAESQYEQRWMVESHLQANIAVPAPMQFADQLSLFGFAGKGGIIEVDTVYPPSRFP